VGHARDDPFLRPVACWSAGRLWRVRERNVRGLLAVAVVALLMAVATARRSFRCSTNGCPLWRVQVHSREVCCGAGTDLRLRDLAEPAASHLGAMWNRNFGAPIRHIMIGLVLLQG